MDIVHGSNVYSKRLLMSSTLGNDFESEEKGEPFYYIANFMIWIGRIPLTFQIQFQLFFFGGFFSLEHTHTSIPEIEREK